MTPRRKRMQHLYRSTQMPNTTGIDPWSALAQGIVLQAIYDWRDLVERGKISNAGNVTFNELRRFLAGVWCGILLSETDIEPEFVLSMLEDERRGKRKPPVSKRSLSMQVALDRVKREA